MSKKQKSSQLKKQSKKLFVKGNFPGIYRIIFTFCEKNKTAYYFSLSCRNIYDHFLDAISRSSIRYYRLLVLNKECVKDGLRRELAFNLYKKPVSLDYVIDGEVMCATPEEYQKTFVRDSWYKVLGEINKEYGNCCFVSGSYALKMLFKDKKFGKVNWSDPLPEWDEGYVENVSIFNSRGKKNEKSNYRGFVKFFKRKKEQNFLISENGRVYKNNADIDIFILGKNQKKICEEVVQRFKKTFKNPEGLEVEYVKKLGLVNMYVTKETNKKDLPVEFQTQFKKRELVYQLILKKIHDSASSVFAFFDLDINRIGFFPKKDEPVEVMTCIQFIRSISTGVNYCDLYIGQSGYKHFDRICKYYHRLKVVTSLVPENMFSYYYSFKNPKTFRGTVLTWLRVSSKIRGVSFSYTEEKFGKMGPGYYRTKPQAAWKSRTYGSGSFDDSEDEKYFINYQYDEDVKREKPSFQRCTNLKIFSEKLQEKKLSISDTQYEPYIVESVGIIKNKARYKYDERDFEEIEDSYFG